MVRTYPLALIELQGISASGPDNPDGWFTSFINRDVGHNNSESMNLISLYPR
jgi:hypothetical protein